MMQSQHSASEESAGPPRHNIVLIGFMGTGKSTVGERVAAGLGFRFADTDALIEQQAGMPIPKIFADRGESGFRALETAVLRQLMSEEHLVVSTGGGIVTVPENLPLLRRLGFVILLTASEDVIYARISANQNRPLLRTADPRATIRELLAQRLALYKAAADMEIETAELTESDIAFGICETARVRWSHAGKDEAGESPS